MALSPLARAATNQINTRDQPASLPHVASIQYSGSGCPSSAPGVDQLGSWNDLAFRLNNYEISLPNAADSTANCEVHLQVTGCSAGWQLGIKEVYVKGHLVLDPGAEVDFYVTTFWSQNAGTTSTVRGTIENSGATRTDQIATAHASIPNSRIVWSPCSSASGDIGTLNVNFRAALQADGNQYGYFGKGSDTTATESWGYVWRRC
ncbi:hypothetical protein BKA67DRAFT_530818 [Truncatella angustata]|uniref:Secreted protein n=1 Tax=Truncatella angustata TaxID=152316 RepID=A0A9P8UYL7_9PEZI|nr:uncharacterized protein BKA67DRAFT_530818 [Truncatella angustata]KAH6660732.1 hypothetical protein BKA67DRAFT_530818 [Truncatella angustata]